jgi:hypothetical protein
LSDAQVLSSRPDNRFFLSLLHSHNTRRQTHAAKQLTATSSGPLYDRQLPSVSIHRVMHVKELGGGNFHEKPAREKGADRTELFH